MSAEVDILRLRLPSGGADPRAVAEAVAECLRRRLAGAAPNDLSALRLRIHLPVGLPADDIALRIVDAVAEALP